MFEVRFPKDVRSYKEKPILGLTIRQFVCTFIGLIIGILIYLIGIKYLPESIVAWVVMIIVGFFFLLGWKNINGLTTEKYLLAIWESSIAKSRKRYFVRLSPSEKQLENKIKNKKEELKIINKELTEKGKI